MLFSSPIFLFAFLPLLLALHALLPKSTRNALLLVASLLFYWWGEPVASTLMVVSILLNYAFGLLVGRAQERNASTTWIVGWAVGLNLAILFVFKYADWVWNGLGSVLLGLGVIDTPLATIGSVPRRLLSASAAELGWLGTLADRHLLLHFPSDELCHRCSTPRWTCF